MISGANEEQLELANARADILLLQQENQSLKKQLEEYKKELEKADSITQSCIFNGKKDSEISYRKCLNMLENLKEENKQLKKQLEELKSTNKVLSEELTKDKILKQDCLTTCCGISIGDIPKLKSQQKEFISYLENIIKEPVGYNLLYDGRQKASKEILSKYKQIIGKDINVGTKGGKDEK